MTQARKIEVGERLRECRVKALLSIDDVRLHLGVSKQAISAWENGDREPSGLKVADMALLYGVSTDYILLGTHMVPDDLRALFARVGRGGPSTPDRPPG